MAFIHKEDNSHFISLSDMMTGLMVIFLFISVAYMIKVKEQSDEILEQKREVEQLTTAYYKAREDILQALRNEFSYDLAVWKAKLEGDLSIVFTDPDILFDKDQTTIKPKFKEILSNFFPRYISVIQEFKDFIKEVRIEGYTDSDGLVGQTLKESYFYNMWLSQGRSREVLGYCLKDFPETDFNELKELITANGLSFSHLKKDEFGKEDKQASRRVEFRIETRADDQMKAIDLQLKLKNWRYSDVQPFAYHSKARTDF